MALSTETVKLDIAVDASGTESVKALADSVGGVGEKSKGAAPALGQLREEVERIGDQAAAPGIIAGISQNLGKLAAVVAGYFGIKLFATSVESAREFEAAMSRVAAAAGATAEEFAALKEAAEVAGASTQYTAVEAAAALENLAKAGLSASDAIATLPAVLDLATAGGVDLATSSEFISKAVAGMGLTFADAGRVADVLAKGANASNTSVTGLAQALSYAAPLANSLGLSLEETVAIIGKFADAGIDASRAGTALNSILAQFSDPASRFRRELEGVGISTDNFGEALRQLAEAGPDGQKAILAVGQEAGPALRALLNQGIDSLDRLKAQLDDSAGSARTFAGVMSDNLSGASKGLASAWESLKIRFAEPVLGPLKDQADALAGLLRRFVENGTVSAFGDAVAKAFQAAAVAVRSFIEQVDFDVVSQRLKLFAAGAAAVFDDFGQKAANAGNVAKVAYGAMATTFSVLLASVYKLGEGISWMTAVTLADLAKLAAGLDRVTPDVVTERFAKAAASLREESAAAASVMRAFGQKAQEALEGAAEGAETAREGWSDLTAPIAAAGNAAEAAGKKLGEAATQAGLTADQLDVLGEGAEYAAGELLRAGAGAEQIAEATGKVGPAAAEAAAKIAELRAEYQRLIQTGDTQAAAKVLVQIQAELDKTRSKATATADKVEEAFKRLGVASSASLKAAAEAARADFDLIRAAGTASAADIRAAFTAYAEAAVKANGGVVDALLQQQAGQVGLRLEADKTGKLMVKTFAEVATAAVKVEESAKGAATGISELGQAAAGASAAAGSVAANWDEAGNIVGETAGIATRSAGQITEASDKTQQAMASSVGAMRGMNVQAERWAKDLGAALQAPFEKARALENALSRISAQQDRLTSSAARGVDDLKLRLIELNGTEDEIAKARLERDKADVARQIRLIELEIKRAAVRGESGEAQRLREEIKLLEEQLVLIDRVFKAEQRNAQSKDKPSSSAGGGSSTGDRAGGTTPKGGPPPRDTAPLRTVQVNLNLGGKTFPVFSDEVTADKLLRDLETLQRVSS